jgi:hypothetical protein
MDQFTVVARLVVPTPVMAPAIVWVVDTGAPSAVEVRRATAPPVSALNAAGFADGGGQVVEDALAGFALPGVQQSVGECVVALGICADAVLEQERSDDGGVLMATEDVLQGGEPLGQASCGSASGRGQRLDRVPGAFELLTRGVQLFVGAGGVEVAVGAA